MITESAVRNVTKFGNVVEASYTIEDSAKIFGILRSNIYSNKILAVIREYSTNGWDGHVLAGTPDRPLLITLPTTLSPVFKVRDFGVGLSEDSVMHIYTSYGTSTKDNSNDFNGTFGLGSKSAFAYGNTFGITSYFNGTKTLYTAYLDETNIGKIRKEFSEPTSEENGVEIEIAVKSSDIRLFSENASEFFKHFVPCPDFVGGDGTTVNAIKEFHNTNKVFSGEGWAVLDRAGNYTYQRSPSIVRMGNVAYPLDVSAIGSIDPRIDLIKRNWFVIDVPIGSVSITASREALEYDKRTKTFLENRIIEIHSELLKQSQEVIDNCDSFWLASCKLNSMNNLDTSITNQINMNKWSSIYTVAPYSNYYGRSVYFDDGFIKTNITSKHGVALRSYGTSTYMNSPRLNSHICSAINPRPQTLFILNRPGKVKKEEINWRIRGASRQYRDREFILVEFAGKDTSTELKNGILKGAEFVNLEDFEIVKWQGNRTSSPKRSVVNDLAKVKIFTYNKDLSHDRYVKSNNWTACDNELIKNGSGVYVNINSYEVVNCKFADSTVVFREILTNLQSMNIDIPTIYGIRDSVDANKMNSGFVNFDDWVVNIVNKHIAKNKWADYLADYNNIENLTLSHSAFDVCVGRGNWGYKYGYNVIRSESFLACDIKEFAIRVDDHKVFLDKIGVNKVYNLYRRYGLKGLNFGKSNIQSNLDELSNKYPGLQMMLSSSYNDETICELVRYIKHFNID